MPPFNLTRKLIRLHEGERLRVYDDATGKDLKPGDTLKGHATIGIGRHLCCNRGILQAEALFMLENDLEETHAALVVAFPWFSQLSDVRQAVLMDMCFNLGLSRLLGFKKFLVAVENGHWYTARREMLDSVWAVQVGARAQRLAEMMLTNNIPKEITS